MKNTRAIFFAVLLLVPLISYSQGMEEAKTKCADLGFTKGTEKFGSCVLRLTNNQENAGNKTPNFVIEAPTVVDNGAVVPVNITFNPPLLNGKAVKILVNKELAYEIQVLEGSLSKFQARVLMPMNPSVISVQCNGCQGEQFKSEVKLVGHLQTVDSTPASMKIVKIENSIKALVSAESTTSGNFLVTGNGFKLKVALSKYVVKDPFFGFVGSINNAQYCGEFVTSGSSKSCTEN